MNWFPDPSDTRGLARAQLVCRDCPVKLECADHALVEGEKFGVWAGVNVGIATWERERARKNSERARARRSKEQRHDDRRRLIRGGMHGDDDPRHGTLHGYTNIGCRCEKCHAVMSDYNRGRNRHVVGHPDAVVPPGDNAA